MLNENRLDFNLQKNKSFFDYGRSKVANITNHESGIKHDVILSKVIYCELLSTTYYIILFP